MSYQLTTFQRPLKGNISLTSSKSESNRSLLINALSGNQLTLSNLSAARDTQTMKRLLNEKASIWDVLDAGTTMRFCTAYLAIHGNGQVITGTPRMCQRPIGLLVDALRKLGASIDYEKNEGFPPLKISGITQQKHSEIAIPGNISSQFISALLMIAPCLPKGLSLHLTTEVYSRPYIEMTLRLMQHFGVSHRWIGNTITILNQTYQPSEYTIESDWSGASYWYSMAALNNQVDLHLSGLRENSLQGDQDICRIMEQFGVHTTYDATGVILSKSNRTSKKLTWDFKTCPDLAQTVMVTAAVKGVELEMTGLESLRIKETDRIAAMANELKKLDARLIEDNQVWRLLPGDFIKASEHICTYEDHRMAMAFAPVCQTSDVTIDDPEVVAKSYPAFWEDLRSIEIQIHEL